MKKITTLIAVTLGLCALGVTAQEATETKRVSPATRADKNGDGVLSQDEWTFGAEQFTQLDKNGDGAIDATEQAGLRGQRGKGGAGHGKGAPGKGGAGHGKGGAGRGKGGGGA
jgi:hypothetical protein